MMRKGFTTDHTRHNLAMANPTNLELMKTEMTFPKGHRLWFLIGVVILAIAGMIAVSLQPELERNLQSWATASITLITALLALVWLVFLSRLRWRTRLKCVAVLIVAGGVFAMLFKVDGTVDGRGLPRFVWKWSKSAPRTSAADQATRPVASPTSAAVPVDAMDVPQFFGPNRDGVVKNSRLTRDWSVAQPKQLWRQPVGAGWSAFAVVGGRACTQEQRGENECVTCYDLLTGRLLWTHSNPVHFSQWQGGDGPRATPTVHQGRVFTMGATGILDCLDAATGQRVWSRDVLSENKLPNLIWGVSVSPLVFEDTVVVTGGMTNGPTVLAYRRSNGEPLWRAGTDKASYASPIIATLVGQRVVLSFNAASLTAHDPKTGDVLLNYPWTDDKWPKASQPVVLEGNRVFISAGYGAGCALLEVKAGADGKLVATQLWKNLRMKTQFNSAAARDGFLYGLDDGLLACVEISTGDRKWKDGRYGSGQTLLVNDMVLIQSEPGAVVLAEAKPEGFKELGRIAALTAKTWNHPTLAGRYLLVRNSEEMACYELPLRDKEPSTASR